MAPHRAAAEASGTIPISDDDSVALLTMLDLRRLRLLRELHERGTIAAVADALQFTPSAVSQQLAVLEREAGVPLLERAGRGVRLTDAALVLVGHADALLERAALAEADLAAAAGTRRRAAARIAAFQSVALQPRRCRRCEALARDAPRPALRARRGRARAGAARARARRRRPRARRRVAAPAAPRCRPACERHDLLERPGAPRPARQATRPRGATRTPCRWPSSPASRGRPATPAMGWEEMTQRTCRELGGFDPDIRHRTNDATISLALVARGLAVTLLPDLPLPERPARASRVRAIAEGAGRPRDLRRHARRRRRAPLDAGAARRGARRRRRAGGAAERQPSAGASMKLSIAMSGSRWLALRKAITLRPVMSSTPAESSSPMASW